MKVTVERSDQEMEELLDITGERKKGPAIRRLMEEALQQRRRIQIAQRFLSDHLMSLLLDTSLWIAFTRSRRPSGRTGAFCVAPRRKAGGSPAAASAVRHLAVADHPGRSMGAGDGPGPGLSPDRPRRPKP